MEHYQYGVRYTNRTTGDVQERGLGLSEHQTREHIKGWNEWEQRPTDAELIMRRVIYTEWAKEL